MANIFLDTNFLFDITQRDTEKRIILNKHIVFVSALSYHILFYTFKYKVPDDSIIQHKKHVTIVGLTDAILTRALQGPTNDLEDNIQLHSAVKANADVFLTSDKNLLNTKFFGKMQIASKL